MLTQNIKKDYIANRSSIKSLIVVLFYRCSNFFALHDNKLIRIIGLPIRIVYKLLIEFIMSIEFPDKIVAGSGLRIFHGIGLVVNDSVVFGKNVTLRQNTTIGSKIDGGACPVIGDNVNIGANVVIIGDVHIGRDSIIGAGSVVIHNFPECSVIAGNPAKLIRQGK